ncbi:MAG: hypothetical protein DMF81_22900 [Acidobacteria bacterium]|nr:MAG: hypothetical protein DMF81_22900 [Acidobacteriota bacterium]
MRISPAGLRQAQALVAHRLGLQFPDGRVADMQRGLADALRGSAFASLDPYLAWLAAVPDEDPELRRLAARLTIGETHFFRDGAAFEALERHVLPSLIAARSAEGVPRLRLWSAGCATGEEPYSLAIELDRLLRDRADWSVTILATDINTEALEVARRGIYRDWSLRGTPPWVRERYFHRRRDQTFELDRRIRGMVTFAPLNLASDGYPSVITSSGNPRRSRRSDCSRAAWRTTSTTCSASSPATRTCSRRTSARSIRELGAWTRSARGPTGRPP